MFDFKVSTFKTNACNSLTILTNKCYKVPNNETFMFFTLLISDYISQLFPFPGECSHPEDFVFPYLSVITTRRTSVPG